MKIIDAIFDARNNERYAPGLWLDQSIQTDTLTGQEAMLVNRQDLSAKLEVETTKEFCLVISRDDSDDCLLGVDPGLLTTGHLADLASIPRTYFRRLLRSNPGLAVKCFNHGIRASLCDRGKKRYGQFDRYNPDICITRHGGVFYSAYHADDAVFLLDMFEKLVERLKKNFSACFADSPIRSELEKKFPKSDVQDMLMSANKWEMRIIFRDNDVSPTTHKLKVNDPVKWGISVTISFEDSGVYMTITPIVWRLVCTNGMIMPSSFGLPMVRVKLTDLPNWRNHPMTWRTLLGGRHYEWIDVCDAWNRRVHTTEQNQEIVNIAHELLGELTLAIMEHAHVIATHKKLVGINQKIQRSKKLGLTLDPSDESFAEYVAKILNDQGIKTTPQQVQEVVNRLKKTKREKGEHDELTLWDVINAVTNYAQKASTYDQRVELETCATKLLVDISEENFQMVA